MIFKKDNLGFGMLLGFIAPFLGFLIYKFAGKFKVFSLKETLDYMRLEPGHATLTVALTLSLLANAVLFTIYINGHKDKTGKGIFASTCIYAMAIILLKFLG